MKSAAGTALLLLCAVAAQVGAEEPATFARCSACHAPDSAAPTVGPSLKGVFGRKAGSRDDFRYSRALTQSGIVWNEKNLDAFLEAPDRFVPGTRMPFEGIASRAERAAVIRYLKSLK